MLKKLLFGSIYVAIICVCQAQKKAVTDLGEEVILHDNKTWEYINKLQVTESEIKTNPATFQKSEQATFLLKSNKVNVGFWLNTQKWKFAKASRNPSAEYELRLIEKDLYGMVITEEIEIPLLTLKNIAVQNAQKIAPDTHIIQEEYRMVNGTKVLFLQMDGTTQGIKFSYYSYYYSSPDGVVQFVTYSAQNLIKMYQKEIDELLNGLVKVN